MRKKSELKIFFLNKEEIMKHETLTVTITDDKFFEKTLDVAGSFPREYTIVLGLFSAMLASDIFDSEFTTKEETKVYPRKREKYSVGEHDFFLLTGGSLEEKYQVEHYKGDTLIERRIKPDMAEAFKFVLASLADYLF